MATPTEGAPDQPAQEAIEEPAPDAAPEKVNSPAGMEYSTEGIVFLDARIGQA